MTAAKKVAYEQIREIPIGELRISPSESRKTIDQAALKELAASIKAKGVLEALIVRLIDLDCMTGSPISGVGNVPDAYEIVAGQRRFEASKIAGKATCPCIVRELTDEEAREQAIVSNRQRQDLAPMEEAEAYRKLVEEPGATVESVAAAIGIPSGYVSRRLKLLDAIEPVREALSYGAIEVGHALELARLSPRQQQELLEWLEVGYRTPEEGEEDEGADDPFRDDDDDEGICKYCEAEEDELRDSGRTWLNEKETVCSAPDCVAKAQAEAAMGGFHPTRQTVAELRKRVVSRELRILGEAPFPLEDEIPPMACIDCPKRTRREQGLFDDILRDACTDPDCYETKLKVWVKAELERAELVMLYDGSAQDKAGEAKWNVVVGAECGSQVAAIWVSGRLMGRRVQICRDKKCATHGKDAPAPAKSSGSRGGTTPKLSAEDKARADAQKAEREKLLKKVETEKAYRERLWKAIAAAHVKPGKAEEVIVRHACAQMAAQAGAAVAHALDLGMKDDAFDYGKRDGAIMRLAALPYEQVLRAAALGFVVADLAVGEYSVSHGQKAERMEEIAALLGLDVAAIRAGKPANPSAKKAPAKTVSKPAAKPAAKKPAKPVAKKAVKKVAKKGTRR